MLRRLINCAWMVGVLSLASNSIFSDIASVSAKSLTGSVKIDGSSTVFPITEAIAEEYRAAQPRVRVTIGVSGTGGGFKKFIAGETDISNASRHIKPSEIAAAAKKSRDYLELSVAYDGISIVVHKDFPLNEISLADLKRLWEPGSKVATWRDLQPGLPETPVKLYGPGPDSGTFDFFTKAVMGKESHSRSDYNATEDDNVIVKGVSGDTSALGYFGYAYYYENKDKLKTLAIKTEASSPAVKPELTTIADQSYALARPVFVYVSRTSSDKKQVDDFIRFYLTTAPKVVKEVGYVALPASGYQAQMEKYTQWRQAATTSASTASSSKGS